MKVPRFQFGLLQKIEYIWTYMRTERSKKSPKKKKQQQEVNKKEELKPLDKIEDIGKTIPSRTIATVATEKRKCSCTSSFKRCLCHACLTNVK